MKITALRRIEKAIAFTMNPSRLVALREAHRDIVDLVAAAVPFANLLQDHHDFERDETPLFGINDVVITAGNLRRLNRSIERVAGVKITELPAGWPWRQPEEMPRDGRTIIVKNALGQVCPMVGGIIQNRVGDKKSDWEAGQMITGWMDLPEAGE